MIAIIKAEKLQVQKRLSDMGYEHDINLEIDTDLQDLIERDTWLTQEISRLTDQYKRIRLPSVNRYQIKELNLEEQKRFSLQTKTPDKNQIRFSDYITPDRYVSDSPSQ